jgi:hypothetical protein
MYCQCDYKSNIRTDCIHYHCEYDMGASIDCCTLRGLGNCPCTKDCPDYVDKAEVYRYGLEALKHPKVKPPAQLDNRLTKIADLMDGTIDHFDLDDAMDLLYQIKGVLKDG